MIRAYQVDRVAMILFAVLIIVQGLTALNVLAYFPNGFWTEGFYHPTARDLLSHGVYGVREDGALVPTTMRPPLYSALLAVLYWIFGPHEVIGVAINNLMFAGVIILTYLTGRQLNPVVGLLACLFVISDTIFLAEANRNESDMMFTLLVVAGLYATIRAAAAPLSFRSAGIAALLIGLATFTRAAGLYLWIALVVVLLIAHWNTVPRRRLAGALVVVLVINGAFIVPWMMRNESITGNSDFAGMKGTHLTNFFAPLFISKRYGISYADASQRISDQIASDPEFLSLTEIGEKERYYNRFAAKMIRENLPYAAIAVVENIPRMFLSYASEPLAVYLGRERFETWYARYQQGTVSGSAEKENLRLLERLGEYYAAGTWFIIGYGIVFKVVNFLVVVLGAVGCILLLLSKEKNHRQTGLAVFLICGVLTATAIIATQGRFRMPIMPGLAVAAAYTFFFVWQATWGRRGKSHRAVSQA